MKKKRGNDNDENEPIVMPPNTALDSEKQEEFENKVREIKKKVNTIKWTFTQLTVYTVTLEKLNSSWSVDLLSKT